MSGCYSDRQLVLYLYHALTKNEQVDLENHLYGTESCRDCMDRLIVWSESIDKSSITLDRLEGIWTFYEALVKRLGKAGHETTSETVNRAVEKAINRHSAVIFRLLSVGEQNTCWNELLFLRFWMGQIIKHDEYTGYQKHLVECLDCRALFILKVRQEILRSIQYPRKTSHLLEDKLAVLPTITVPTVVKPKASVQSLTIVRSAAPMHKLTWRGVLKFAAMLMLVLGPILGVLAIWEGSRQKPTEPHRRMQGLPVHYDLSQIEQMIYSEDIDLILDYLPLEITQVKDNPVEASKLHYLYALALSEQGRFSESIAEARKAITEAGRIGRIDLQAKPALLIANTYSANDRSSEAIEAAQQAIVIAQAANNIRISTIALQLLGLGYFMQSRDTETATEKLLYSIEIAKGRGESDLEMQGRSFLGLIAVENGDYKKADRYYAQAIALSKNVKDPIKQARYKAIIYAYQARSAFLQEKVSDAIALYQRALITAEIGQVKENATLWQVHDGLASALKRAGREEEAVVHFTKASTYEKLARARCETRSVLFSAAPVRKAISCGY